MKKIIISLLILGLIALVGCKETLQDFEEMNNALDEVHIVDGDEHNFITFADDVFKKGGDYYYESCYPWNGVEECRDIECMFGAEVKERCVKNGTDGINTHTDTERRLFQDCCTSLCNKKGYVTRSSIPSEIENTCLCWLKDVPLRIEMYFDINQYDNNTEECNAYVTEQYGEYWVSR